MLAPLKKEQTFFKEFINRFMDGHLFDEAEAQQYRFKINSIKPDNLISISMWAFYWACCKNHNEAMSFFKKSLNYAGLNRDKALVNFIFYLRNNKETKLSYDKYLKIASLLDQLRTMRELADYYIKENIYDIPAKTVIRTTKDLISIIEN